MTRFSAQILMDPQGYKWEGEYGPEDEDAFEDYTYLVWVSAAEIRNKYRTLGDDWYVGLKINTYDPFVSEPALYRIFAALDPTPESILAFASRYGEFHNLSTLVDDEYDATLRDWKYSIEVMREAVKRADVLLASQSTDREKSRSQKHLLEFINSTFAEIPLYIKASAQNGGIGMRMVAYGLMDAMKLQLAEAVVERKQYRNCELCNRPFEVSPQVNRADRVFCTDNCRVKAYQRRKKQALDLRQKGASLREIVQATGSDLKTVKRWLPAKNSKEK